MWKAYVENGDKLYKRYPLLRLPFLDEDVPEVARFIRRKRLVRKTRFSVVAYTYGQNAWKNISLQLLEYIVSEGTDGS